MTETEWTKKISDELNIELLSKGLHSQVGQKIPYSIEISSYGTDWTPYFLAPDFYETDLIVYEEKSGKYIPRVIIEAKYERINTHAAIAYCEKAQRHKNLMPQLRYGMMLGNWKNRPLPGRLLRNGTNFDFMFRFEESTPKGNEWKVFVEMIFREIEYSKQLEEVLHETRSRNRKNYFMLQKQLILEEQK